jgi:hypothetical protein
VHVPGPTRFATQRRAVSAFAGVVALVTASLWTAQYLKSSRLGAMVLVVAALAGSALTRPGWNVRPRGSLVGILLWCGLLSASGIGAAALLTATHVALPYAPATIQLLSVLPGMVVLVATEEFFF